MAGEYDIIVVGAGPAGCSAALHSSRGGLNTLLLEEHEKIGEPVHCGECLSEYATQNMGIKLPEEVISAHVKGVRVVWPNGKGTCLNEKGFVLEKQLFEQWLAREAESGGAKISALTRLEALKREKGIWLANTNNGKFEAKIIIDASGVSGATSRLLGLNKRFATVTGIQCEILEIPREGYMDFYLWPALGPHGYLWMIPKKSGRANVGLVTNEPSKAKKNLDLFIEKMGWQKKDKVKTFGGLIPASGPVGKTFAEGLMIAGDAAGFTSPMFEGGTHLAMKSAYFAAQVAKSAIEKNNLSLEKFAEYEALWKKEFPPYEKILQGKNALYGFSEAELNLIANSLPENFDGFGLAQKLIFGAKILAAKPSMYTRGFVKAMGALDRSQARFYGW